MFGSAELDFSSQGATRKAEDPTLPGGTASNSLTWEPGCLMQDTRDCPYTTHSFKTLGKCYKKCPYFSSLSMKYMHNVQESYKKIILLAITYHLTESLKARSTIHQAQEYPGGYAYIASLKKEQKGVLGAAEGRARCHTHLLATRGPPRRPADPPAAILPEQGCCHPKLPPSSRSHLARAPLSPGAPGDTSQTWP